MDLWNHVFLQVWIICDHYLFKYCLFFSLSIFLLNSRIPRWRHILVFLKSNLHILYPFFYNFCHLHFFLAASMINSSDTASSSLIFSLTMSNHVLPFIYFFISTVIFLFLEVPVKKMFLFLVISFSTLMPVILYIKQNTSQVALLHCIWQYQPLQPSRVQVCCSC